MQPKWSTSELEETGKNTQVTVVNYKDQCYADGNKEKRKQEQKAPKRKIYILWYLATI